MARNGKSIFISHHNQGQKTGSQGKVQPNGGDKRYIRRNADGELTNAADGRLVIHADQFDGHIVTTEGSGVMRITQHQMKLKPLPVVNLYTPEDQKEGYSAVFSDKASYDRSVDLVVARIKSGAIKARTPDE